MKPILIQKWKERTGSVSVEFLAILPMFLLVCLLVMQVAVSCYGIVNAQAVIRDVARMAAVTWNPDEAKEAAYDNFGKNNRHFTMENVDVRMKAGNVEVHADLSLHMIFLPGKEVSIPVRLQATSPAYDPT